VRTKGVRSTDRVALLSSIRKRIPSVARWLAPSAVAACAGATVAGVFEGAGMDDAFGAITAAGFLAIPGVPILLAASALARGLWAAWRPAELGERLIEDGGGAPRLAGWALVVVLGAVALAWAMFQGTWLLAAWTAFKPLSMSFAEPVLALGTVLAIVVMSRPVALGTGALFRRLDARWRRHPRRITLPLISRTIEIRATSLVTPRRILIASLVIVAATSYVIWRIVVRPRIGVLDLGVLEIPAAGIATAWIVHVAWTRWPRARRLAGGALAVIAAAAIGVAVYAWQARPSLTLGIWGERPLAGLAIDKLLDLDAIRGRVALAEFRPSQRPGAIHPDIVLVTIDTVRADHTPVYGGGADMPALVDLARKGVTFEWAFSPSNVTRRSIPSMITGLAPNRVRGRVVGWALRVDPRHVMVAERLAAGGYETAGFMCCEGFWGKSFHTGLQRGLDHLELEPNGQLLARHARTWLEDRERHPTGKPLFLWIHILEPHNWQQATGEPHNDDERRRYYDRALASTDLMLIDVLAGFAGRAPGKTPIVVVSADHGEGLGDHGQPFHSTDLYNSQIHVPLVIAGPGIKPGRIAQTVSLTDLTPTLVELAGFDPPSGPSIDGHSFAGLATGRTQPSPDTGVAFAAMIKDRSNPGGIAAVVKGRWKLIDNGSSVELYDVHADPDERANLFATHPAIVDELKRMLVAHVDAAARSPF
jgi:arylsulfatase A-like enzyme